MSVYRELRTTIEGLLNAVDDIGEVHNRARWNADLNAFINLFRTTVGGQPQIRGWMITRESVPGDLYTLASRTEVFNFTIRGYLGVQDTSDTEGTFNDLVEEVLASINGETAWTITAPNEVIEVPPVTAREIDVRMFGSVLAHYCKIELPITVRRALEV